LRIHDHDEPAGTRDARATPRQGGRPIGSRSRAGRFGPVDQTGVLALQRTVGNARVAALLDGADAGRRTLQRAITAQRREERSPVFDVVGRGGGRPLEPRVRETMEDHLGTSLDSVRVHVDARSTESVQAKAYTVGEDIVVHPQHFSASSSSGRELLAHEAVHVAQQRSGPVSGTPVGGGISLSDPSDRFEREAEATARRVSSRL
jgi:uncharacterized protein DUF4157